MKPRQSQSFWEILLLGMPWRIPREIPFPATPRIATRKAGGFIWTSRPDKYSFGAPEQATKIRSIYDRRPRMPVPMSWERFTRTPTQAQKDGLPGLAWATHRRQYK